MTQTLRRERKQKFLAILESWYQDNPPTRESTEYNERVAEYLADAAMSRSELSVEAEFDKPNIYKIYEANIGPLTPLLSDELNDIDTSYPDGWFLDACKEAVSMNIRNLKYVRAIMENRKNGKGKPSKQSAQEEITSQLEKIANGE